MTWEELIDRAVEHARSGAIPVEQLHTPKVRETVVVSFTNKRSRTAARIHMDASTGELISIEVCDPEFSLKSKARQFQLSKRAQRVLALASEESKRMGCDHVGSDHLLLGLLVYGEGNGVAVLSSAGLTVESVRDRIRAIGSSAEVASNDYAPSMLNILCLSSHKAETSGVAEIEPEHLVLSLLDRVDGPAMSLFRHFRVDTEQLKASLLRKMSQPGP